MLTRLKLVRSCTRSPSDEVAPLPEGEEKRSAVSAMFDAIAPRYDAVNKAMSLGLDSLWRRRTVQLLGLPAGALVLDVGCGTGDLVRALGRASARPVGIDISAGMLTHARAGKGSLIRGDAAALPFPTASFDAAVSGFALRNFSDLAAVLGELGRVVRPGGRLALLEVSTPTTPSLRAGHAIWFNRVVPRIGAILSDEAAYRYLPRSVAYLPSTGEMRAMLDEAGFAGATRRQLSGGIVQVLTGTRRV